LPSGFQPGTQERKQLRKQRRALAKKERRISRLESRIDRLKTKSSAKTSRAEGPYGGSVRQGANGSVAGGLPDFIIIGAQKCGTTYLFHLLGRHPHVKPSSKKEVHYFDTNFDLGLDWYRTHFPPPLEYEEGQRAITGEASPYYLSHPQAAERAAEVVPRAKLIVLLRNPVDRAYSHYHARVGRQRETLGFEEAIEADWNILKQDDGHRRTSYLSRGVYVDQLRNWHDYFEREQMLILKSEDFYSRTQENMALVLDFLSLPGWRFDLSEPKNKGRYEPMGPATRQSLKEYFEPHNRRLYEYLGADLGW
jgi:hypothetical protein